MPVSVGYATADNSASAPADYAAASGTLDFAAGQTSKQVTVLVNGDALDESNETYFVNLTGATNATIADPQGSGTITDDDALPTVSIGDVELAEGDTGTKEATFSVTLGAPSGRNVSVGYTTVDGSATAPADYVAETGSVSFAAGETSKTLSVTVNGDLIDELTESFGVSLAGPVNATLADDSGAATITDDDAAPSVSVGDVTVTEGNGSTVNAVFTLTLSSASGLPITVDYATADASALSPADYATATGNVSFSPGQTSRTVTVVVAGDSLDENDETFTLNVSNAGNATIADNQGVGTITDNDAVPNVSVNDVTVTETDTGTTAATFTVTLSAVSGRNAFVDFSTAGVNATSPADFAAAAGTLQFSPGETTKTVTVDVNGDVLDELNETYQLNLSNPLNAAVTDGVGLGTINDNDPQPALSVADVSVTEGNSGTVDATFTVSLSAVSGRTVTVDYATVPGSATAPADFTTLPLTNLSFSPGQTTRTVTVTVHGDVLDEGDDTFNLNLSTAVGATISDASGQGTILDDDALPSVSVNDVTVTEGDIGTTNAVFTVTLSTVSGRSVTVDYATANASAVAPGDYTDHQRLGHVPGGRADEAGDRPGQGRHGRRGQRDLLAEPVGAAQHHDLRPGGRRDDHRQRLAAQPSPSTTSRFTEGNSGTVNAVFNGLPLRAERPDGERRVGDGRQRLRDGGLGLRGDRRERRLQSGRHDAHGHRPDDERHARRARRDVPREARRGPGERDDRGR